MLGPTAKYALGRDAAIWLYDFQRLRPSPIHYVAAVSTSGDLLPRMPVRVESRHCGHQLRLRSRASPSIDGPSDWLRIARTARPDDVNGRAACRGPASPWKGGEEVQSRSGSLSFCASVGNGDKHRTSMGILTNLC